MNRQTLRASTVAIDGRGVLILGASGRGKSALALELIALGAELVSDDLTDVVLDEGHPVALAPARMTGVIEARGVGLLRVPHRARAPLALAVDLDREETERLPPNRVMPLFGTDLPLIYAVPSSHFAAAVLMMVRGGRLD